MLDSDNAEVVRRYIVVFNSIILHILIHIRIVVENRKKWMHFIFGGATRQHIHIM